MLANTNFERSKRQKSLSGTTQLLEAASEMPELGDVDYGYDVDHLVRVARSHCHFCA